MIRVQDQREHDREETAASRIGTRAGQALSDLIAQPLPAGLYLVSTPIGNLGDISLRALAVLARADLIAAEDTRHSKKLLSHFGIHNELTPYHEHNAERERPRLVARMRAGFSVALISDAGTPLVSDPGFKLVREALDQDLAVTSIPGPSAAIAALTSAGLPTDSFFFAGFLPPKPGQRRARLGELKGMPATLVIYEAAPRLAKSLADMADTFGPRQAAVAKELTKLHETVMHGTLDLLAAELGREGAPKGEFVVVVAPPSKQETAVSDDRIVAELKATLKTDSFRDSVRKVTAALNVNRSRVYELGLSLSRKAD